MARDYYEILGVSRDTSPEDLKKLFERFSQVDGSATRKVGGTGLGLSLAQRAVKLHRGTIRAETPAPDCE